MSRKLFRSTSDSMIGGVCGGLGEYFGIDSTIVRLLFVAGIFLGGGAIFIYLIAMIIIPKEGEVR